MKNQKVHYVTRDHNRNYTGCGRYWQPNDLLTNRVRSVTCLNCQRSRAYQEAARGATFNENDPAVKEGKGRKEK